MMKRFNLLHYDLTFLAFISSSDIKRDWDEKTSQVYFWVKKCFLNGIKRLAFISSSKATRSPHPFVDALIIEKTQELQPVTLEIASILLFLSLFLFSFLIALSPYYPCNTHTHSRPTHGSFHMSNVIKSLGLQTLHGDYVQITMINSIGDISPSWSSLYLEISSPLHYLIFIPPPSFLNPLKSYLPSPICLNSKNPKWSPFSQNQ